MFGIGPCVLSKEETTDDNQLRNKTLNKKATNRKTIILLFPSEILKTVNKTCKLWIVAAPWTSVK